VVGNSLIISPSSSFLARCLEREREREKEREREREGEIINIY